MEEILKGYHFDKDLKGYYKVEFYDDDGRCLNHWLSEHQIAYFKNRDDAVAEGTADETLPALPVVGFVACGTFGGVVAQQSLPKEQRN